MISTACPFPIRLTGRFIKLSPVIIITCYVYALAFFSLNKTLKVKDPNPVSNVILGIRSSATKPHMVLGILSAADKTALRQTQRTTWISAMLGMKQELPFRITYKFLIDSPSNATIRENSDHKDILYLNISTHGRAVKFGEKMYKWLKYINKNYPDVILGAKLDDDTFLCVPQIFHRLDVLLSFNLYYGWKHGKGRKIHRDVRIDEMFVVLGKNLISRIAKRNYCGEEKCKHKNELIDTDYGDSSLADWLSVYDDVDIKSDNNRIIHFGASSVGLYDNYIKPNFCKHQLVFHKSTTGNMIQLHKFNAVHKPIRKQFQQYNETSSSFVGSVTGLKFTGNVKRSIPPFTQIADTIFAIHDNFTACENWAVVTTIFLPSLAVGYISKLPQWCLVIIADTTTPPKEKYIQKLISRETSKRIKYLSIEEQTSFYPMLSRVIPFKHFGRKNIGYMYAIHHKAKYIWDFDDDNKGIFDLKDLKYKKSVTVCTNKEYFLINPYPYFGITESRMWPRGLPLQNIKDNRTIAPACPYKGKENLAVIQSLANKQPDVDAIFRLTRNVPINFTGNIETRDRFILPKYTYGPFNAQATLWLSSAFRYMALPISVNGRVSDIWRSYIAQHFFHRDNLSIAFSPPYVTQERNVHEIIADFNAELDIYEKSLPLVQLLRHNKYANITNIYKDLYSRNYLEREDLNFINVWTKTLSNVLQGHSAP